MRENQYLYFQSFIPARIYVTLFQLRVRKNGTLNEEFTVVILWPPVTQNQIGGAGLSNDLNQ